MGRWMEGAPARLTMAALDLIEERGYDATTAADIAERAGLTERTFFRHFPAKRDVLFGGTEAIADGMRQAIADTPADAGLLAAAVAALAPLLSDHAEHRDRVRARSAAIASHADLRERELSKREALADTITAALIDRGGHPLQADAVTHAVLQAYAGAVSAWLEDDGTALPALVEARLVALKEALVA